MRQKTMRLRRLWLLICVAALTGSCIEDQHPFGPDTDDGVTTFTVKLPATQSVGTRAATGYENYISSLHILLMDHSTGNYIETVPCDIISGNGGVDVTVKARIPYRASAYDLLFVANVALPELSEGATRDAVREALVQSKTVAWNVGSGEEQDRIPMFGELTNQSVNGSYNPPTGDDRLKLRRMLARVNVEVDGNAQGVFKLRKVHFYNYNTSGNLIPGTSNPSIPEEPGKHTTDDPKAFVYDATAGISCLDKIYVFENENAGVFGNGNGWLDNPCIVVEGYYGAGNTTEESFYRLDFIAKSNNSDEWLDVIRNYSYNFRITSVSGHGYGTVGEALISAPANMNSQVVPWDDIDIAEVAFDGPYTLAISRNKYEFEAEPDGTQTLTVKTDYPTWTAKVCDEAGNALSSNWLTLSPSSGTTGSTTLTLTADPNPSYTADRTAYIHITAGRITLKVEVTQEKAIPPGVRSVPGVIGYFATGPKTGQLTLDGDGAEGETVYVAYFKWGSLVATSSQQAGDFTSADIVAAKGFGGNDDHAASLAAIRTHVGTGSAQEQWDNIPYGDLDGRDDTSTTPDWPETNAANIEDGLGDACTHYFGNTWRTPTRQDNIDYVGRDGDSDHNTSYTGNNGTDVYYLWSLTGPGSATNVGTGTFPMGAAVAQGSPATLPAAGYRRADGAVFNQGSTGYYWSSSTANSNSGRYLYFSGSVVSPTYTNTYAYGFAIRCVNVATYLNVSPLSLTFGWNEITTPAIKTVTVESDGPWSVSVSGDTGDFTLSTNGGMGDGSFTVIPKTDNIGQTTRQITITVTATGATALSPKTVEVTQEKAIPPGVRSVPGVIGYFATGPKTGQLTLDGDGAEGETVYVAYFKWGSLVATSSQKAGDFTSDDIVAAKGFGKNDDHTASLAAIRTHVGTGSAQEQWDNIPYGDLDGRDDTSTTPDWPDTNDANIEDGLGDACTHYFGNTWRTPTRQDNIDYVGRDGDSDHNTSYTGNNGTDVYYLWSLTGLESATNVGTGTFPKGSATAQGSPATLPAAGYRSTDGAVYNQGSTGYYWSSTAAYGNSGRYLYFDYTYVGPSYNLSYAYGFAVRCIQPPAPVVATYLNVSPQSLTFDWFEIATPLRKTVTVESDGPWSVSVSGDTGDFTLSTNGGTGDGSFTVIPKTDNIGQTTRQITITVTATGATALSPKTVEVTQDAAVIVAGQNHVLYFTTNPNKPLAIGRWGSTHPSDAGVTFGVGADKQSVTAVSNRAVLAFFKFGGVVGFTNGATHGEAWSSANNQIKFDPTDNDGAPLNWGGGNTTSALGTGNSLANGNVPGFAPLDYNRGVRNVSDRASYHTEENLRVGKGDPCMLAGIDLSRKNEPNYLKNYDSGWRLPSVYENRVFIGIEPDDAGSDFGSQYYQVSGFPTAGVGTFPGNSGVTLPAAGYRYRDGKVYYPGDIGGYWSSTASSNTSGRYLCLTDSVVHPSYGAPPSHGYAVRCVRR